MQHEQCRYCSACFPSMPPAMLLRCSPPSPPTHLNTLLPALSVLPQLEAEQRRASEVETFYKQRAAGQVWWAAACGGWIGRPCMRAWPGLKTDNAALGGTARPCSCSRYAMHIVCFFMSLQAAPPGASKKNEDDSFDLEAAALTGGWANRAGRNRQFVTVWQVWVRAPWSVAWCRHLLQQQRSSS